MYFVRFILFYSVISGLLVPISMAQTEITAPGPEGMLRGTMTESISPGLAVALIIPGSGPTDRDGNSVLGLKTDTYRMLAAGLSSYGISTIRIDKRGMYGSNAAIADPNAVTIDDYARDIKTWIAVIRERTKKQCVWLIGHSEGGLVALKAAQNELDICGLVLIATPGRPMGILLREQLRANPDNAPILDEADAIISRLESGLNVEKSKINPVLLPLFHPDIQGFLMDSLSVNPVSLIRGIQRPVLIMQGLQDVQVSVVDSWQLIKANPQAELRLLENTNHILKTVNNDDWSLNLQTYHSPLLPLADGVVESIGNFIQRYPPESSR